MPHRLVSFLPILLLACTPFLSPAAAGDMSALMVRVRDNGQGTPASIPESKTWVESLKDHDGVGCCATADGTPLQEPDWEMTANGYRVKVEGTWHEVPGRAVVNEPNRLRHAVVWFYWQLKGPTPPTAPPRAPVNGFTSAASFPAPLRELRT